MEEPIVIFDSYRDSVKANLVKNLLESHSIHCFLTDEHMSNLHLIPDQITGGIKLKMFERDVPQARKILLEAEMIPEDQLKDMIYCPLCHSFQIQSGVGVQKRGGAIALLRSLLLDLLPFRIRRWYHCTECHHEFKR
jgi:hypothetical protein